MMSAKNGGVQTPPPPLVSQSQKLAYPPSPSCQPKSDFQEENVHIQIANTYVKKEEEKKKYQKSSYPPPPLVRNHTFLQ